MHWKLKMVLIVRLMHMERRLGKEKPVIQKTVVDLKGSPFLTFAAARKKWEIQDDYRYPGPIQFFGESEITDAPPITLSLGP